MAHKHELKRLECDPHCGFVIQSHDENEVLDAAMNHIKKMHSEMKVTREEAKAKIKTIVIEH